MGDPLLILWHTCTCTYKHKQQQTVLPTDQVWWLSSAFWVKLATTVLEFTQLVHVCKCEHACISSWISLHGKNVFPPTGVFKCQLQSRQSAHLKQHFDECLILGSRLHPRVWQEMRWVRRTGEKVKKVKRTMAMKVHPPKENYFSQRKHSRGTLSPLYPSKSRNSYCFID